MGLKNIKIKGIRQTSNKISNNLNRVSLVSKSLMTLDENKYMPLAGS
jgi:hypothetical protein